MNDYPFILTTTSDITKCELFEYSMKKFGYKYHIIIHPWYGYMGKLQETYNYLVAHPEVKHLCYLDTWDSVALRPPETVPDYRDKWIFSTERASYPHPEKALLYKETPSPFKHINGGGWMGSSEIFLQMIEKNVPKDELNDQVYLTDRYLQYQNEPWMFRDDQCTIFQTTGHCEFQRDFDMETGMNKHTGTYPIFWHNNGRGSQVETTKRLMSI